ncbi:hypothetical protein [Prescottella equi]|uniref:hypothetical protein n=1 Tax=Rhodococcus hoagii TaxID=43767 RepID=UPI0007CD7801|nr:hypothetical protein [Prescottella equi]
MRTEGVVVVDHHQFVLGERDVDYLQTVCHGTLLDAGPGFVAFYTGIAYGPARITVDVLDQAPHGPDTAAWEVIEESSLTATSDITVHAIDGTVTDLKPVPAGTYRVRAHARGRDHHYGQDVTEPVEDYLVEMWVEATPDPSVDTLHKTDTAWSPQTQVNESSLSADYVFVTDDSGAVIKVAPQSPEAQAVRKKLKEFGGRPLSPTLEAVFSSRYVAGLDRDLIDKIDSATPAQQQAFARWCVRRAWERAGIADIDWLAAVLDNMDAGASPDTRFLASFEARNRLDQDPRITRTIGTGLPADRELIPQYEALHAYSFSMYDGVTALEAAIEAFWHAARTYGMDYRELTTAARRDFFEES